MSSMGQDADNFKKRRDGWVAAPPLAITFALSQALIDYFGLPDIVSVIQIDRTLIFERQFLSVSVIAVFMSHKRNNITCQKAICL